MADNPKHLTAWERWEIASLDAPIVATPEQAATHTTVSMAAQLPTARDIERIHKEAEEQGYRIGYADGREQARIEANRLVALVDRLQASLATFDQEVGEELLALAIEVARRVVEKTVAVQSEVVIEVVRHALAELPHQHATVRLNPEDAALIRSHLGEQLTHAGHRIQEDATLSRGDCLVEGGGSRVDATVATRWRRVLESLGAPADWIVPGEK